jgi:phosphatidylglycerol:prolipoprotein diacylglycerol transferase
VDPVLIDTDLLGQRLLVESYDLFMGLAAAAVLLVGWSFLVRLRLPVKAGLAVLALMLLSIPVGARALNILSKPAYYADHPDLYLTRELVGFSLIGGLLLAAVVGIIACRYVRIDPWRMADAVTPGLLVGVAVIRIGCFLAGCCYGLESELPWAVQFPYGSPAHQYYLGSSDGFSLFEIAAAPTVHPTQVYEMVACLAIAAFAAYLLRRRLPPGVAFLAATIAFCLARLANHFVRVPSPTDAIPYLAYPALYVVLILGAVILLRRRLALPRADGVRAIGSPGNSELTELRKST